MAKRITSKRAVGTRRLGIEPYASMLNKTQTAASRALEHYGEPSMSLEELRQATGTALRVSLSGEVLKERPAGW